MKLTWRLWLLGIVLLFSITSIVNLSGNSTLLLFGLGVGILFSLTSVKSKVGRVIIILVLMGSGIILISQQTQTGLVVKSVGLESQSYEQGIRSGELLISLNGEEIKDIFEYNSFMEKEFTTSEDRKLTITTNQQTYILYTNKKPEIIVGEVSKTNIKLGLDLQGGSRALVKAKDVELEYDDVQNLIDMTQQRLNVYGLSDIVIKSVSDLSGNTYMLIEIAGATPDELESLISQQGKFEAKIGNETVFTGGEGIHVERAGQSAGIEGCYDAEEGSLCRFRFPITISTEAAERHAEITSKLEVSAENPNYLEEQLGLYIDGVLTDSLYISKELKGQETTQISIQGSGTGSTKKQALESAENNMKELQAIISTGSFPYKLEIVKLDTVSPSLGNRFIKVILLAGLVALISVALIVLLRYRKFKLPLALLLTSFSEVLIILGIAAMSNKFGGGWSLDLPALAGIIAVIGTGVDQQIVVLDESNDQSLSLKQRLKRAASIILGSYLTTVGAMFPLMWSGAGLLRGFAIATIVGISVGVFITRPAFADIVKKIQE